jgi:hypothetical protein
MNYEGFAILLLPKLRFRLLFNYWCLSRIAMLLVARGRAGE